MTSTDLAKTFVDAANKEMEKYMQYCKENNIEPEVPTISATHVSAKNYFRLQKWMNDFNNRKE